MSWDVVSDEDITVSIQGKQVVIRQLTNGEKLKLALATQSIKETDRGFDQLMGEVGSYVMSIEGMPGEPALILPKLKSLELQKEILNIVLDSAKLDEEQVGN